MRRKVWILIVVVLALVPVADAILWRIAVVRLESGFDAWVTRGKVAGWSVTHGPLVPGGWPWAATLGIGGVGVSGGKMVVPGGFAWRAAGVTLRVPLFRPRSLDIEATGEQHVRVSLLPETTLTAKRLLVTTGLVAPGDPEEWEILADQPRLITMSGSESPWELSAANIRVRVQVPPATAAETTSAAFSFKLEGVALPPGVRWPLGNTIAEIAAEGAVEGPVPPAQPLLSWVGAWRDGGGSLQLQHTALTWGPLSLAASATLALDDQLQPMGAGTSRLTGYGATMDALAAGGTISRSAAIAAKAVLSLLAGTPGDADSADVEVPLTLQYRTLSMRQVPLLRLPEIDWTGQ